jgi:hypothetical protein
MKKVDGYERQIEKWSEECADYVDTGPTVALHGRELVIVVCSVLDIALAELLSLRLVDDTNVQESFLGTNLAGDAPCASFVARIKLAYLVGLLRNVEKNAYLELARLRNVMAHRVRVDLTHPNAVTHIRGLLVALDNGRTQAGKPPRFVNHMEQTIDALRGAPYLAEVILRNFLAEHNFVLASRRPSIRRLAAANKYEAGAFADDSEHVGQPEVEPRP